MENLGVVLASVRQGRKGEAVANWFTGLARTHGAFEVELLDLKAADLPLLSEPEHPRTQIYHDARVQAWSRAVARQDAFVLVTPEYNFNSPPALINALDSLYLEWNYKPAGFVSYGGASAGVRSAQATKLLLTTLKMVPMVEAVALAFDSAYQLTPGPAHESMARNLLDELHRWTLALRTLRG